MKILSWGATDVGSKREHNEDSFLINRDLKLFLVADGMGGHAGGEMASKMAVEIIEEAIFQDQKLAEEGYNYRLTWKSSPILDILRGAVQTACRRIYQIAQEIPALTGMGTTVTSLLFYKDYVYLAHVGDSRAYRIRNAEVEQISEDHSLVHEQIKAGVITEEEAKSSALRNIITRSVGFDQDVLVDTSTLEVLDGDCFVLCSDGLANLVEPTEIAEAVTNNFPHKVPGLLVDLANARGGDDNITILLVRASRDEEK